GLAASASVASASILAVRMAFVPFLCRCMEERRRMGLPPYPPPPEPEFKKRLSGAAAPDKAVQGQKQASAGRGDQEVDEVAAAAAVSEQAADIAADKAAGDTDQNGDDDTARILSGHDPLGKHAGNEADHDPTDETIFHPLSPRSREPFITVVFSSH